VTAPVTGHVLPLPQTRGLMQVNGSHACGAYWHIRVAWGDNAGMARDDRWAQVLRLALPILDEARPAGMLGWAPRVAPVVTQAVVGAGHWAAGRRRRALAAWMSAAGYGLVAWGLGTEAPTPAEVRENMQQNIQRLQREGVVREPGTKAPPAGTQTPAARRLERYLSRIAPVFRATDTPCTGLLPLSWEWSSACGGACAGRGGGRCSRSPSRSRRP
jgi:hypothetical protein